MTITCVEGWWDERMYRVRDTDFVASADEIGTEHVDMILYATYVRVEEVTDHSAS